MTTRDELRAKLLSGEATKRRTATVNFLGTDIAFKQPSVGDLQKMIDAGGGKIQLNLVDCLIDLAYVPGTEEHIFEEADRAVLITLPWTADVTNVIDTINDLIGVDVKAAEKN